MTDVIGRPSIREFVERPRALPMHVTDYPGAFTNPEPVHVVRVRGFTMGSRIVAAIDEEGNEYPVVGLDPGSVRTCPECGNRVYIPDRAAAEGLTALPCPYTGCRASHTTAPVFGSERVEDQPAVWVGGDPSCNEHPNGCRPTPRPR